ncbi:hypothetical protein MGSAQ_002095 [marine sediment metagenome]|uniref:Uncharacterized protein n=1 Tax=marine sediment metagenome TaxID=412755 RepID=A0A1B6NSH1_9ZZZZ
MASPSWASQEVGMRPLPLTSERKSLPASKTYWLPAGISGKSG